MDIYDDLDNYNEENNIEALQSENLGLKNKLIKLEDAMQTLQKEILQDYDHLAAEHKTLLSNFSALLKTARAEIERKTKTIMQFNTEKDQKILRLMSNGDMRSVNQLRKSNSFNRSMKEKQSSDTRDTVDKNSKVEPARPSSDASQNYTDNTTENPPEPTKNPITNESMRCESNPQTNTDFRNKENQSIKSDPLTISSRRKSIPAFRCEERPVDEDNIDDHPADNQKIDTKTLSAPLSSEARLRENAEKLSRLSRGDPRERQREKYDVEMRERERKAPDRSIRSSREEELNTFKQRALKRSHSRNRLESPPRDRYNRNKSRDRRSDLIAREEHERRLSLERRQFERSALEKHGSSDRFHRRQSAERRMAFERRQSPAGTGPFQEKRRISERRQSPVSRSPEKGSYQERRRMLERRKSPIRHSPERIPSQDRNRILERRQSPDFRITEKDRGVGTHQPHVKSKRMSHERLQSPDKLRFQERRRQSLERHPQESRQSPEIRLSPETHPKQYNEDRELNAKRRKLDHVSDIVSRWGRSNNSPTLPFKTFDLATTCQSPDENVVDKPVAIHTVREIKLTAQTKQEDPRVKSSRYVKVADKSNKPVLTTVDSRNVDLKVLTWNVEDKADVHEKLKEKPDDLNDRPKESKVLDISEQLVRDIYTDIDENELDVSMESGEVLDKDVSDDHLFAFAAKKAVPKTTESTHKEDLDGKGSLIYNANFIENKEYDVRVAKYKIPKKSAFDRAAVPVGTRPLELLYKHYIVEESASTSSTEQQNPKNSVKKLDKISHKKQNKDSSALREMIEGDLALSDDDNYQGNIDKDIAETSSKTNEKKIILEPKTRKKKDHKSKGKNMNAQKKQTDYAKKETDSGKCKHITSKFSDLFGDSSLITPEDLNIPSELVNAENCVLAISDNANFVGEKKTMSISHESDDKFKGTNVPEVEHTIFKTKECKPENNLKVTIEETDLSSDTKAQALDDNKVTLVAKKSSETNNQSNTITLIPENAETSENDVIKTVIISSGVQTQNLIEPNAEKEMPLPEKPAADVNEIPKALATSTPLRITDGIRVLPEKSGDTDSVSALLRHKNSDESDSKPQNFTNSLSESEPNTSAAKVVFKRKKRVIRISNKI